MHRPLWQILLPLLFVALAVHRAAVGFVFYASELPTLVIVYGLQAAAALATAVALWLGRSGSVALLLVLGAMLAASAILEGFWLDLRSPIAAVSQVLIIALSTGALALALRHEFGGASHPLRAARPR